MIPPPVSIRPRNGQRRHCPRVLALACLIVLLAPAANRLDAQAPVKPEQRQGKEVYYDFRGGMPLPATLGLVGPDAEQVVKPEKDGLRITLPAEGSRSPAWGIRTTFSLSGDFELTATYEFLTVEPPAKGGGSGVSFNLEPTAEQTKFAKLGRLLRPKEDLYLAEYRTKPPTPGTGQLTEKTATRIGMLRFQRQGTRLRYLVADQPAAIFANSGSWNSAPRTSSASVSSLTAAAVRPSWTCGFWICAFAMAPAEALRRCPSPLNRRPPTRPVGRRFCSSRLALCCARSSLAVASLRSRSGAAESKRKRHRRRFCSRVRAVAGASLSRRDGPARRSSARRAAPPRSCHRVERCACHSLPLR